MAPWSSKSEGQTSIHNVMVLEGKAPLTYDGLKSFGENVQSVLQWCSFENGGSLGVVWGGFGEALGRLWGGFGEALGRLWEGFGKALGRL